MSLIVETATLPPGYCAVSGRSEGPFIDTGSDTIRPGRVYISLLSLQQLAAEHLNMVDGGQLETLTERVAELEAQVEEAESFKEAVSTVFKKLDRKPPRKRAAKKQADDPATLRNEGSEPSSELVGSPTDQLEVE